ncbi:MBL fold metallo-hydrolase [Pedobacter sp. HMF7647]|uniref:MBL fold metallo-hydrolase n=1 Tax=Hufsiella arboris TaxID=2695275 RepID=A0A7K1YDP2_9SPHI|nr:MBL fold metallo-hydrolase [Hufsiella arboris]MXV52510.1 MBL fold metallo-hydrolase [Hufsiella arboris]
MQRRNFIKVSGISASLLLAFGDKAFSSVFQSTFKIKKLRNNVGIFTEQGGTIAWLVNSDGIIVVDAEFPEPANHLIAELKKQSEKPFRYLINTHHHGDHTSGNISFKGIAGHVLAHVNSDANQRKFAKDPSVQLFPDITYSTSWKTTLGDETISANYFGAGHTNGDSFIHFQNANVVHAGDLVFNKRYPFIDRSAGASVKSWIEVLEKAQNLYDHDTLFVFGHAFDPEQVTGSKAELKMMQNYLARLMDYVSAQIRAGKSKEDILKTTEIPGATEFKGDGIERSLMAAYEELTA